ncbi:siderophore iron transporter Arn1p [[Candida] anglica]|uniref:Siderophore iron transporter Arn1p n=1 Tax=[Candida] anglica TaxID=148631 RepID=A0ABP0EGD9_9ASCO
MSDTNNSSDNSKNVDMKDSQTQEVTKSDPLRNSTSKSIGVRKAELMLKQYQHPGLKILVYFCIFIIGYAYSIDGSLRYTFQAYATASYGQHSLISTVGVIRAVAAAASQPTYARLCDRFGRIELFVVSILFYALGTVIESQAYDVQRFAGGAVLYQIGYSGVLLILQVMLADFSTLNWRFFCSILTTTPFIINSWVSGNILDSLYPKYSWNFCIGMWAFIFPLTCIPLLCCLFHMQSLAKKKDEWKQILSDEKENHSEWTWEKTGTFIESTKAFIFCQGRILKSLFWEIDAIGIMFIICIFGFILVPFTLASGVTDKWRQASTIAPLVVGFVLIPFFIIWEKKYARFPVAPFELLKDRGVWAALIVGVMIDWVWYMPNDFMYTVLMVAMNQSQKAAMRITMLDSFVSVLVGPMTGLLIAKVRRTKGFIMFGVSMWCIALGLLLHFRGDNNGINSQTSVNGVIGALCVMGMGTGFFTYVTQTSIATCTNHEHMAVVMALYMSSYNIGLAFGASISGAVWTNLMYKQIVKEMEKAGIDTALATFAYGSPIGAGGFIQEYVWGTAERIPVVLAYAHVQKILCIVGLILVFPMLIATLFLRDHKLVSVQSLEKGSSGEGAVVNKDDDDYIKRKFMTFVGKK